MKWIENYRVNSHDCDERGRVRPSLILRYMQETANLQLRSLGPTAEELTALDRAFILSRLNMSIYGEIYAYENITVSSWACESRGVSFNRAYQIRRGDELIAEAVSVWGLIGISDRHIYRVEDAELGFDVDDPLELDAPRRVHIPKDMNLSLVGEKTVVYGDIDANRHMNNTNYPDMLCDFLPDVLQTRVTGFVLSYLHEGTFGHTLRVLRTETEGGYLFRTVDADGTVCLEAYVRTEAR